jgi:hypothetical protein
LENLRIFGKEQTGPAYFSSAPRLHSTAQLHVNPAHWPIVFSSVMLTERAQATSARHSFDRRRPAPTVATCRPHRPTCATLRPYPLHATSSKAKFRFASLLPPPSSSSPPRLCPVLPLLSAAPSLRVGRRRTKAPLAAASCAMEPQRASGKPSTRAVLKPLRRGIQSRWPPPFPWPREHLVVDGTSPATSDLSAATETSSRMPRTSTTPKSPPATIATTSRRRSPRLEPPPPWRTTHGEPCPPPRPQIGPPPPPRALALCPDPLAADPHRISADRHRPRAMARGPLFLGCGPKGRVSWAFDGPNWETPSWTWPK